MVQCNSLVALEKVGDSNPFIHFHNKVRLSQTSGLVYRDRDELTISVNQIFDI